VKVLGVYPRKKHSIVNNVDVEVTDDSRDVVMIEVMDEGGKKTVERHLFNAGKYSDDDLRIHLNSRIGVKHG
jgi:hypothetical protein